MISSGLVKLRCICVYMIPNMWLYIACTVWNSLSLNDWWVHIYIYTFDWWTRFGFECWVQASGRWMLASNNVFCRRWTLSLCGKTPSDFCGPPVSSSRNNSYPVYSLRSSPFEIGNHPQNPFSDIHKHLRTFCSPVVKNLGYTPETNIEPENDGLEDDFPLPGVYSQVPC